MKPRRISDDVDGDSSVMKTCCCCMDVRLGTIVLGFCHLVCNGKPYLPCNFAASFATPSSVLVCKTQHLWLIPLNSFLGPKLLYCRRILCVLFVHTF